MQVIHLNIGLNVAGVEALQMPQIAVAIGTALPGAWIRESYIRQSATERTACIVLSVPDAADLHAPIMALCGLLEQDAIAGRVFGENRRDFLIGPKAAEWGGVFNEDHWLVPCPDNEPIAADDALWNLRHAVMKRSGWTMAAHESQLSGWFERDSDGTGGGLWYSRDNPETGEDDGALHLVDYDGTYALPRPVLVALRLAGVSMDSTFE